MMVLVLSACPRGLRGQLTRWLFEVSAGVYVGRVSSRIRGDLWERVIEHIGNGRALLIWSAPGDQGLQIRTHGHHWEPEDFDGLTLFRRPPGDDGSGLPAAKPGWSRAGGRRRAARKRTSK